MWKREASRGSAVGGGEAAESPWALCWGLDPILQGKWPVARPEAQACIMKQEMEMHSTSVWKHINSTHRECRESNSIFQLLEEKLGSFS